MSGGRHRHVLSLVLVGQVGWSSRSESPCRPGRPGACEPTCSLRHRIALRLLGWVAQFHTIDVRTSTGIPCDCGHERFRWRGGGAPAALRSEAARRNQGRLPAPVLGEFPEVADDSEPELSVLSATFPELPHQLQGLAYGTPPSATAVASSAVLSWSRAMIVAAVLDLPGRLDCEASGLWQGKDLLRDCPPTGAGSESGTSRPQRPRRAGSPRWSPVLGERLGPGVLVEVRVLPDVLDLTAAAA
jgi:hypothetical protein